VTGKRLCLLVPLLGCGLAAAETHRFAVVMGNNAGSGARPTLRYAETDAVKMARVLVELGDVPSENLVLLQGGGLPAVQAAMRALRDRITEVHRQPDARAILLFYFSGHGDGEALELGAERLAYPTLRAMLTGSGADLKVAIIDACRSGSAVQEKGGKPAPGFTIRLTDQATARGEIFITSSAADESALESNEVRGSFFTHNLLTGLRGAADVSGDRLVTLSEAYRYAYDRTVSATALTPAGAQHPHYDYRLSGQGELILASLVRSTSTLQLPEGAERALVTDVSRDQVVAELLPGGAREIALGAGTYGIRLMKGGQAYGGRFRLEDGSRYAVRWEDVDSIGPSRTQVAQKGGPPSSSAAVRPPRPRQALYGLGLGGGGAATEGAGLQGSLRLSVEPSSRTGPSFAVQVQSGASLTGPVAESAVGLRVGYRAVVSTGRLFASLGAETGPSHLWVDDGVARTSLGWVAGPRAAFRVKVGGPAWLGVEAEAPFTLLDEPQGLRATLTPQVVLGMALEL
jgi:hypothetical protein